MDQKNNGTENTGTIFTQKYDLESFGYYSDNAADESNRALLDRPLVINCAGHFSTIYPFKTENTAGRHDYYLMYIASGHLTLFNGETPIEVGEGNVFIFPAETGYKYVNLGGEKIGYFWVHFTGSEVADRLHELDLALFPTVYIAKRDNHIIQRFNTIFDSFSKQDHYLERELSALMERLLITVARHVVRYDKKPSQISRSLRHIGTYYGTDIKITDLAEIEHLSVSRYNHLFKKQMGIPPTKYILQLRMASAKDLLNSTDLPIKQIGNMCGYEDPHFFSKSFKSHVGVSPAQFRKKHAEILKDNQTDQ